jgi:site-specific recombinase XerD
MTSDDLLVEWLNSLKEADRSPKTIARYRGALGRFLAWYEDEERRPMELADLTPIALVGYRSYLRKKNETSTVNVHISALRAWCQWMVEHDYLDESPAARLRLVGQVQADAPEPLSDTSGECAFTSCPARSAWQTRPRYFADAIANGYADR